ncbi:Signal peptide region containing protein [Cryptosporidium tyzzeri]|nr:Signal peptide region containing protein [Cryptosporidium tyzzeri]
MNSQVLYLTFACFIFFYFKEIGAAELPNSSNKIQVATKPDIQNVDTKQLKAIYSIFCQLMCLLKLLNLFKSLNISFTTRQSQELLLLLSKEESVLAKHAEIRKELSGRKVDLLSSIDVNVVKKFSSLTSKLTKNIANDSQQFVELLLELIQVIQSIICLITSCNLEISITKGFSSESVRDSLLSLNEDLSGYILDATQQNENQEQGVNKQTVGVNNLSLSFSNEDLYNDESGTSSSPLDQELDLYLACPNNSNNKEIKTPTSSNELRNNNAGNGANKKNKIGKNKDNNVNSKENIDQIPHCGIQPNWQCCRLKYVIPSNTSGVKTQAAKTKLEASNADEGGGKGNNSTPKKRTSKKKHTQNPQSKATPVQHAEHITLDPSGGAKQKVKTRNYTSKNNNGRNSRRSRSPSPKPCTSSEAQTGSSSHSSSSKSQVPSSQHLPSQSSGTPVNSRSTTHLKGKSGSRKSRSRSRRASPTAPMAKSITEGCQSKDRELEVSETLFFVQEAEEILTKISNFKAELLNLSFILYKKLEEMERLYQEIVHKGDKFAAIMAQMEIIKMALEDWKRKIDFSSDGKYILMNARSILEAIPASVAARLGLASRVCGDKDCCKVGHPSDKYIVGANVCGCRMCDCSCLFCLPDPSDSPRKSIYDVD